MVVPGRPCRCLCLRTTAVGIVEGSARSDSAQHLLRFFARSLPRDPYDCSWPFCLFVQAYPTREYPTPWWLRARALFGAPPTHLPRTPVRLSLSAGCCGIFVDSAPPRQHSQALGSKHHHKYKINRAGISRRDIWAMHERRGKRAPRPARRACITQGLCDSSGFLGT